MKSLISVWLSLLLSIVSVNGENETAVTVDFLKAGAIDTTYASPIPLNITTSIPSKTKDDGPSDTGSIISLQKNTEAIVLNNSLVPILTDAAVLNGSESLHTKSSTPTVKILCIPYKADLNISSQTNFSIPELCTPVLTNSQIPHSDISTTGSTTPKAESTVTQKTVVSAPQKIYLIVPPEVNSSTTPKTEPQKSTESESNSRQIIYVIMPPKTEPNSKPVIPQEKVDSKSEHSDLKPFQLPIWVRTQNLPQGRYDNPFPGNNQNIYPNRHYYPVTGRTIYPYSTVRPVYPTPMNRIYPTPFTPRLPTLPTSQYTHPFNRMPTRPPYRPPINPVYPPTNKPPINPYYRRPFKPNHRPPQRPTYPSTIRPQLKPNHSYPVGPRNSYPRNTRRSLPMKVHRPTRFKY